MSDDSGEASHRRTLQGWSWCTPR